MRIFLAFEGGGAKGVVHVGALRALETQDFQIAGVAGTSAGAIVASLVAAGYTSSELISADGSSPALEAIGLESATDFFGSNWTRLAVASWATSDPLVAGILALLPCAGLSAAIGVWLETGIAWTVLLFIVMGVCLTMAAGAYACRGLATLNVLVAKLELALSRKLGLPDGEPVLFRHLDAVGRPLRVVATDLAARRLKLFSSSETPNIRVSEAVAASAALPIACGHRIIDGRKYVDGGIVSNLPAWTFDEERALDPDAVTIAISIDDGRAVTGDVDVTPYRMLTSVLLAAMFGRRHLETRAAPRLVDVHLETNIGVIDFDMTRDRARIAVEDAARAAEADISQRLVILPNRFEEACEKVRDQIDLRLSPAPTEARTRVLVALRDPGAVASWRVQYGCGILPVDTDDQLLLPEDATVVGRCVQYGAPVLEAAPLQGNIGLEGVANRYRRALVRADLEWCLAIPIFPVGRGRPVAVVTVDSNVPVRYFRFDEDVVEALADVASGLVLPVVASARDLQVIR
ncbi:MAG: patatin-like phospholipase family protein [Alphaproteobacteria bacterium]|nr:patatin-like phospholipase family protein [Alphaproteobacteria bacterium]MBV8409828.1 patatin-like phospholipase family protein [Alphaproteobacteria bacterium]